MTADTIHTCSYSCERPECIRAQRDELAARLAAAQHQPAEGEEIMVNTPYDVFILPLRPSVLDGKGPRFVVHVPGPEQTAAVDGLAARLVDELDGLVSESGGVSGLHLNGDVATWEELLPGGRFERLSSLDELRKALAAQQQGGRGDE